MKNETTLEQAWTSFIALPSEDKNSIHKENGTVWQRSERGVHSDETANAGRDRKMQSRRYTRFRLRVREKELSWTMRHDRNFWVVNGPMTLDYLNLEERWAKTGGDRNGEVAYQYFEMFHCDIHTDTGCDYERQGCLIMPGDTVVDVGGNMGIFARRAWERGASRIVSFEPQRHAFSCYLKNAKPEMEPYNLAISNTIGVVDIKHGGSRFTGGGSIVQPSEEELLSERVITLTLDSMFENGMLQKVDFLKIDVEGAEKLVLEGLSDDNLKKFRCISMEIHRNVISDSEREDIVKRIENLGYVHFAMFYGGTLVTYNFWKK